MSVLTAAMSSKLALKVDWATHEAAKYAVLNWHYSQKMPNGKLVKVGVWENDKFIGVVLFGDGANNNLFKPYGLDYTEGCELVRVALTKHVTPVTKIIAIAFKFLKKQCPKLRIVVSFADPEQGHHGGIYQGGNWIYDGMTTPADEYIVNGKRIHGRALRHARKRDKLKSDFVPAFSAWLKHLDPNAYIVKGSAKHRYLYPLDKEIRAKIEKLAKPYPKRAVEKGSSQTNENNGGAVPTQPLQSVKNRKALQAGKQ